MQRAFKLLFGGWGRQAAWAALLAFVTAQVLAPSWFEPTRLSLFDLYQTTQPRLEHASRS
jgi:hypothetical protein